MGPLKWKIIIIISLGELFVVKMMGPGGQSMNHKTFGNMGHPNHVYIFEILQTEKSRRISPKVTKINTVTPLRSENLDILMKWKIVGEIKIRGLMQMIDVLT